MANEKKNYVANLLFQFINVNFLHSINILKTKETKPTLFIGPELLFFKMTRKGYYSATIFIVKMACGALNNMHGKSVWYF